MVWDHLVLTNNLFMPMGWRFRDGEVGDLLLRLPAIPKEIHATTPNAKLRIKWVTASTDVATAIALALKVSDRIPGETYDPSTFDFDTTATDTSAGAGLVNEVDIALSTGGGLNLSGGRELIAFLRRNSGLAADILITSVLFIADKQ